jgi:hypothetical protein
VTNKNLQMMTPMLVSAALLTGACWAVSPSGRTIVETSYRFVGGLIGEQRRADTLARNCWTGCLRIDCPARAKG